MKFICLDGKFVDEGQPHLLVSNRSYRYGEGFFETMRMQNGKILLEDLHIKRITKSLVLLQLELPVHITMDVLKEQAEQLCIKNGCSELARIRLSFYGGNGGINETSKYCNYIIESWSLPNAGGLNDNGLVIGVYNEIKKSCDLFSNLKAASFLPYVMAAKYARQQRWNDCLVLNSNDRVADASIANIFIIKNGIVITPALSEACVDGVMRKYILNQKDRTILESTLSVNDILEADEVFLTNAISGIKWVGAFGEKRYSNKYIQELYASIIQPLFKIKMF